MQTVTNMDETDFAMIWCNVTVRASVNERVDAPSRSCYLYLPRLLLSAVINSADTPTMTEATPAAAPVDQHFFSISFFPCYSSFVDSFSNANANASYSRYKRMHVKADRNFFNWFHIIQTNECTFVLTIHIKECTDVRIEFIYYNFNESFVRYGEINI